MLKKTALILAIIVLSGVILYYGKPFLVPVVFAGLLASLLFPLVAWFEKKGVNRALGIIISEILVLSFFVGLITLLTWQISDLSKDAPNIEKQLASRYEQLQSFISEKLHVPPAQQKKVLEQQKGSSPEKISGFITAIITGLGGFATDAILTLVYIFLFLYFRENLHRFIIRLVPEGEKDNARDVMQRSQKVTQKYLTGLAMMIVSLWIMYGIGFSIAGVKSPVFFAILCGILEIIPFVGNLIGTTLTVLVSLMQGGDMNVILGILITYGLVQFFQTYILEPLVVGAEVNLNPLFTILTLVAWEIIWGLPGMILAIPLMGVTKIICDHIEPLHPFGELIGGKDQKENGVKKKGRAIKQWIKRLSGKK